MTSRCQPQRIIIQMNQRCIRVLFTAKNRLPTESNDEAKPCIIKSKGLQV